ncbi:hypothetical protein LCGC14_0888760 [marine sediment metagenome]|uniref:Uncharacterized protein n=1 Tax=marine sediment metagenome TaxID=412755 RepID=A0A0F9S6V5_9ZZZZ
MKLKPKFILRLVKEPLEKRGIDFESDIILVRI